jgi:hypothetical protein
MEDAEVHKYKQPEIKLDKHIHEARHVIMIEGDKKRAI